MTGLEILTSKLEEKGFKLEQKVLDKKENSIAPDVLWKVTRIKDGKHFDINLESTQNIFGTLFFHHFDSPEKAMDQVVMQITMSFEQLIDDETMDGLV